jgi:peroxiredoxin
VPSDFSRLPPNLPVPEDDGGADHLRGMRLPAVPPLPSTLGSAIDLTDLSGGLLVAYVYPRTGTPGEPMPEGWDDIPGARGCTPQSCAFRDSLADFESVGAALVGISAQSGAEQAEFAAREGIRYPLLSDPSLLLADSLGLPTFRAGGSTIYRRLTLILAEREVRKVFYPVFPPDRNAGEVLAWLRRNLDGGAEN